MFSARLVVERGSIRDPSQDWGAHAFASPPSPGDRIVTLHEGTTHYLTVLCVHHRPVRMADDGEAGAKAPTAEVVAKWTGSD